MGRDGSHPGFARWNRFVFLPDEKECSSAYPHRLHPQYRHHNPALAPRNSAQHRFHVSWIIFGEKLGISRRPPACASPPFAAPLRAPRLSRCPSCGESCWWRSTRTRTSRGSWWSSGGPPWKSWVGPGRSVFGLASARDAMHARSPGCGEARLRFVSPAFTGATGFLTRKEYEERGPPMPGYSMVPPGTPNNHRLESGTMECESSSSKDLSDQTNPPSAPGHLVVVSFAPLLPPSRNTEY